MAKGYWEAPAWDELEGRIRLRMKYEAITCKFCGSPHIVRNGSFRGVQRWLCKTCGRAFVANAALPKMKVSIAQIADSLSMYFRGMSLGDVRGHSEQEYKNSPSDSAIYNWVTRFSRIAIEESKGHKPNVGDTWVADETVLNVGGKKMWLWDIIDSDTRYLLASHLSPTRTARDARKLMELAAKTAGKTPKVVITDKLASYIDGVELAFGSDTTHKRGGPFDIENDTNLIERMHGTIKSRTKVMRGFKKRETAEVILEGWLVYYNFFRRHEALGGKTPAGKAGIRFPFKNWLDVVNSQQGLIYREGIPPHMRVLKSSRQRRWRKAKRKPQAGLGGLRC